MKKYFQFNELGTNYKTEILAGITTFLSMAYILFVNPSILSLSTVEGLPDGTGMDPGAVFVATALASAIGTFIMGIYAKYPVAQAPAMGVNAFFAYTVVLGMGISWETALAGTLVSGLLFMLLVISGVRENVINAIPKDLKLAVGAGIGLFIAFIGMQSAGIVVSNPTTLVSLGNLSDPEVLLSIFGILVSVILFSKKVHGAIFYGMVLTVVLGIITGLIAVPTQILSNVPSIAPTFGVAVLNLSNIFTFDMIIVILTLLFIDFFTTSGTLVAVFNQTGLMKDGKLPRANKALLADASATTIGAVLGTSTTTSYVESSAGIAVGGRSGFTSVITGLCFILALFFSPLLSVITGAVTAPALIIVGILMASSLKDINWKNFEIAVPAFFTVIMMPFTYSIETGISIGFIFYPLTMILKGRKKEVHSIMYVLAVIFTIYLFFII